MSFVGRVGEEAELIIEARGAKGLPVDIVDKYAVYFYSLMAHRIYNF